MTDTLKPVLLDCPFCGLPPLIDNASLTGRNKYWWVACRNQLCTVLPSGMQCLKEAEAITAWNRRQGDGSAALREAWKPISTAPKDGSEVLIVSGGIVYIAYWSKANDGWLEPMTEQEFAAPPTVWQPCPTPPSEAEGLAAGGEQGFALHSAKEPSSRPSPPEEAGEVIARALCFVPGTCERNCPDLDHRPCPDAQSAWRDDVERILTELAKAGFAITSLPQGEEE